MGTWMEALPIASILLALSGALVTGVVNEVRRAYHLSLWVSGGVAVLSLLAMLYTLRFDTGIGYAIGGRSLLWVGPLQALLAMAFAMVMAVSLAGGRRDLFRDVPPHSFYFTATELLEGALLVLLYANDAFVGYVFLEVATISTTVLIMAKGSGPNFIGSIRYLFMSFVGSGLFLLGLAFLNGLAGTLLIPGLEGPISRIYEAGIWYVPLAVTVALVIAGLGIKSAMFPFYLWLPDAHAGATTSSSALTSGLAIKGGVVMLITLMYKGFSLELLADLGVTDVLLLVGALGMISGALAAMRERDVKRMLAFSTAGQMGYIFMGLGLGTTAGMVASCFHILVHACCKPLLFVCAGRLSDVSGHHRSLQNLRGSAYRDLVAGAGFTVGALSMIGIPMFGGFVSKLYFSTAAISTNRTTLTLLTIALATVLNALYYVPAVLAIWERPAAEDEAYIIADNVADEVQRDHSFEAAALLLILAIFVLGIFYHPITDILNAGVRLMQ